MSNKYNIYINGVYKPNVIWSGNARSYDYRKSYELSKAFTFFRLDAQEIIDDSVDTTYDVLITRDGANYFTGSFRKIDCKIDEDELKVEVVFKKQDNYSVIEDFKDREFDIIQDLGTPESTLSYDTPAAVQLYFQHSPKITTVTSNNFYEGDVGGFDVATLQASGFEPTALRYLVVADHDTPVSGLYKIKVRIESGSPRFYGEQIANPAYEIDINSGDIEVGAYVLTGGNVDYTGAYTNNPFGDDLPALETIDIETYGFSGTNSVILTNVDGQQLKVYCFIIWIRVLTNETTFQGFATTPTDNDTDFAPSGYNYQISPAVFGYTTGGGIGSSVFDFDVSFDTATTGEYELKSGMINNPSGGLFHVESSLPPVTPSLWQEGSIYWQNAIDLSTGNTVITLENAYSYEDIINKWFEWRGVNLTVSMPYPVYLTPSTNVTVGRYDIAAKKGKTTLAAMLLSLQSCFNADYHFEGLVLTFNSKGYYENLPAGLDLTVLIEPKSSRKWDYRTSKYTYSKAELPERIEFKFPVSSDETFEGQPIIHKSPFIDTSKKKTITAPYITNIQYAILNPADIGKDLMIMMYSSNGTSVGYEDIGGTSIQNGHLSWTYLHEIYHRVAMACTSVNINKVDTMATSVLKTKIQEVDIPFNNFDAMSSIVTTLGAGKVVSVIEDMTTGILKVTLHHDI